MEATSRVKVFPVRLAEDLWAALAKAAIDENKTLHAYIVDVLRAATRKGE